MKKQLAILILFFLQNFLTITIYAQGGTWTWISGSSNLNSLGVYGTQGVPSVNNHPPGVYETCEWKDKQGNFWIYGGIDFYSDLWKFNPTTLEWTWIKGNGFKNDLLKPTIHRNFAIIDAAMNDLIRPALYEARMDIQPVTLRSDVDKRVGCGWCNL